MTLLANYRDARRDEDVARLRRVLALRALVASCMSQRQIAASLGITQHAVSQQFKFAPELGDVHPEVCWPRLRRSSRRPLGSTATRALPCSDPSVATRPARTPTSTRSFSRRQGPRRSASWASKQLIEQVLGREIDLIDYGGLKPGIDDDIRFEAVLL